MHQPRYDIEDLKDELQEEWADALALLWASGVPMNAEGGSGGSDDDSEGGDDDDTDADAETGDDDDDDDGKTPEQVAIDKAHDKLRDAEKKERAAVKRAEAAERKNMNASDAEKARADAAEAKVAEYEEKEARAESEKDVVRIAKGMKFINPTAAAKRFLPSVGATDREIRTALKEAIEDFPTLVGDGSPPPPVNEEDGGPKGSNNREMNTRIRSMAGRG